MQIFEAIIIDASIEGAYVELPSNFESIYKQISILHLE